MAPPLRGAIIGAGFFGGIQAEAWKRMKTANLVAVADPDLARAEAFAEKWGISAVFPDVETTISSVDVDFVDIATRPDTHLELVRQAASMGKHCICQKPMARTYDECLAMVAACDAKDVRLLIHENWRWQPWYRAVQRAIVDCELGQIFHLRFHVRTGDGFGPDAYTVQPYFSEMTRFLIYETIVHHLDTARFIAGEVRSLYCQSQRVNPKILGEDCVHIALHFESGATGSIDANRINGPIPAPKVFGLLTVECENGAARIDQDGKVWVRSYGQPESEYVYRWADQGYRGDSVFAVQEHMIQCLSEGAPCESEGRTYLNSVQLVEACYESAGREQVVLVRRSR